MEFGLLFDLALRRDRGRDDLEKKTEKCRKIGSESRNKTENQKGIKQ
jgi:hypothetical protein